MKIGLPVIILSSDSMQVHVIQAIVYSWQRIQLHLFGIRYLFSILMVPVIRYVTLHYITLLCLVPGLQQPDRPGNTSVNDNTNN